MKETEGGWMMKEIEGWRKETEVWRRLEDISCLGRSLQTGNWYPRLILNWYGFRWSIELILLSQSSLTMLVYGLLRKYSDNISLCFWFIFKISNFILSMRYIVHRSRLIRTILPLSVGHFKICNSVHYKLRIDTGWARTKFKWLV